MLISSLEEANMANKQYYSDGERSGVAVRWDFAITSDEIRYNCLLQLSGSRSALDVQDGAMKIRMAI
jgi:hypothetical protein